MLHESLKSPEARRRQHMRQHGEFEKIRSQNPSNDEVFGQFLNIFPEAPKWMFYHPFNVFWCLEGPRTFPEWSWTDLGNINFSWKFSKIWPPMSTLWAGDLRRVLSVWPETFRKWSWNIKESTTKLDLFFERTAPEIFGDQGQKSHQNFQKMTLGACERNLRLVPGWPRITLIRAQEICSTSH